MLSLNPPKHGAPRGFPCVRLAIALMTFLPSKSTPLIVNTSIKPLPLAQWSITNVRSTYRNPSIQPAPPIFHESLYLTTATTIRRTTTHRQQSAFLQTPFRDCLPIRLRCHRGAVGKVSTAISSGRDGYELRELRGVRENEAGEIWNRVMISLCYRALRK